MFAHVGALLRARGDFAAGHERVPVARILVLVLVSALVAGATIGAFGGRPTAMLYAALKLPILLLGSFAMCVPFFFVVNALLGLAADFPAAARAVLSTQGTVAVSLAALSPCVLFSHACGATYPVALVTVSGAFVLSILAGQRQLARHYEPLIARAPRHRTALRAWAVVYVLTSIKLSWFLRPFVGDPGLPVTFLREGQWHEDPYVSLFWTFVGVAASVARIVAGS